MGKHFSPNSLGTRIAHARRLLAVREGEDVTVPELAARMGMSTGSVYGWEADEKSPRDDVLMRLAGVLGVTPAWLRYGVGEMTTPHSGEQGDRYTADQWRDVTAEAEAALAAEEAEQASTTAPRKNAGRKR